MGTLKDCVDEKTGQFFTTPPYYIQAIVPADDVAKSLVDHLRFNYRMTEMLNVVAGPNSGRVLLIYQYVDPQRAQYQQQQGYGQQQMY